MHGRRGPADTGEAPATTPPSRGGGRVLGPVPHRRVFFAGAIAALALFAGLAYALTGHHGTSSAAHASSTGHSSARYGGIPSWLPKARVPVGRVVHATEARPALAIEGDSVSVSLARGQVLATAVGPSVPEEGRFPVPATSPCTFIVTFAAASGAVPLSPAAFTIVDELGRVHHPRVTAMGGGPMPRQVAPGRSVSLSVYDVLPTGNGSVDWTPTGARPIVAWDFEVEID